MTLDEWEAFLAARLGGRVRVAFGRARTRPIQAEWRAGEARIRLHRFFLGAPEEIREALASWLRFGRRARRACGLLDAWIDARLAELGPRVPRRTRLRPGGTVHQLEELAAPLFQTRFPGAFRDGPRPGLTWGRRGRSRARRSLLLGSYSAETHTVRVHPVLDRDWVPAWFVRYILFHELLHAAAPGAGCRSHGPAFQARERAFPDFTRARAWQRNHLSRLIREARRG